jgi:hypothetical protein
MSNQGGCEIEGLRLTRDEEELRVLIVEKGHSRLAFEDHWG